MVLNHICGFSALLLVQKYNAAMGVNKRPSGLDCAMNRPRVQTKELKGTIKILTMKMVTWHQTVKLKCKEACRGTECDQSYRWNRTRDTWLMVNATDLKEQSLQWS